MWIPVPDTSFAIVACRDHGDLNPARVARLLRRGFVTRTGEKLQVTIKGRMALLLGRRCIGKNPRLSARTVQWRRLRRRLAFAKAGVAS